MAPRNGTTLVENPVCTAGCDLPPPPEIGAGIDPAEPHPDEPGAPPDAPDAQPLNRA